ncbi:DUF6612 family protein [Alkalihalobacterium elongatum]|uniref:DUF6612 family protein n=1 Tax=Alkalihalobacterium elongatum TaxID=2675466 RepID=UPI001C1F7847|nr:DUF6612 family protein [Alkalihalobacterium elongatum]
MRFYRFIIFAGLLLCVTAFTAACQPEIEQLTKEEVLNQSIEAMKEVQTYNFELDSISKENDSGTLISYLNGTILVDPLKAHIVRTSKVSGATMSAEVYITGGETYYLMDEDSDLWVNVSPDINALGPAEELELILENIDLFNFIEDNNGYRFTISTSEEGLHPLWQGLFPFYYVMDDPLFHTMLYAIRTGNGPSSLNYEMIIDKETFYRTSAMMEYSFNLNIVDDELENKVTEMLYITYDSFNEVEEVNVPDTVIQNAKTYGEILFGERELVDEKSVFHEGVKGNTDGNHLNGSYFATDGEVVYYSNWMQESGIYKWTEDHLEKELISEVLAKDLNVVGDWLYYSDERDGFNVYRMKKDGTEVEKMSDDYAIDLRVIDDWIFYKTNNPLNNKQPLYMVSKDGIKIQLIDDLFRYTVYDNQVIYQKEPKGILYVVEIDEMDEAHLTPKVIDYPTRTFIVEAGWVYYESALDGSKIYRVELDGTKTERLTTYESQGFNVAGDGLYFTNVSKDHSLYRLDLNTLETEQLDDRGSHIHIINGRLYYSKHISALQLGWFQMDLNGMNSERAPF